MTTPGYDAIVIGGGTMGTAAAWALGKRGASTLVLEQFGIVHPYGSHGGKTRIIRHAYAEGAAYVPLVRRADTLWQELEAETGQRVLVRCGGLELAAPGHDHAMRAAASAERHAIPHERLSPVDVTERWPTIRVPADWDAMFSTEAGFLLTDPAIRGMADLARRHGVEIREHEPVRGWSGDGDGLVVATDRGRYAADRVIVTAGAWASRVLGDVGVPLEVRRKTLFWLDVAEPASFAPERFPVFIADSWLGEIYGFPIYGSPGLKIADHAGGQPTSPETVDRAVSPGEADNVVALAQRLFAGVSDRVIESTVCLYTMTPDTDFVLDRLPADPRLVVGAGFSGHGFKFAPAVGEHLADLALRPEVAPFDYLSLTRFAGATTAA